MNTRHQTSKLQRLTLEKSRNRSDAVFTSCFIRNALVAVMAALFCIPASVLCETDKAKTSLRQLSSDESQAILERLGNMRKDISSLQADFIEERSIPSLAKPLRFEGRIYYRDKTLFFMEYEKPVHHILSVKDNEALFFVEGSKTADLVDISAVQGIAGNAEIFAVDPTTFSGQVLEDEDAYILEENRQGRDEKVEGPKLSVYLNKKNLMVKKILMADESGDITAITLLEVRTNRAIPQSVLSFELPQGVKINRLNQP
jgi:outer membrane lipoprotein-sorting protein